MIKFTDITKEMLDLHERKNADYGDSFSKSLDEDGLLVLKIRLMDKLNRFNSLIKSSNQKVNDESLRDTLIDLANYAVMGLVWLDNKDYKINDSLNLDTFTSILTSPTAVKNLTGIDTFTKNIGEIKDIESAKDIDLMDRNEKPVNTNQEECDIVFQDDLEQLQEFKNRELIREVTDFLNLYEMNLKPADDKPRDNE